LLKPGGIIHLKTDSVLLHHYTRSVVKSEGLNEIMVTDDIYGTINEPDHVLRTIQTAYEKRFLGMGMKITYVSFSLPEGYGEGEKIFPLPVLE
jgi:tRNA (guanine-N7-)-methyltransferase